MITMTKENVLNALEYESHFHNEMKNLQLTMEDWPIIISLAKEARSQDEFHDLVCKSYPQIQEQNFAGGFYFVTCVLELLDKFVSKSKTHRITVASKGQALLEVEEEETQEEEYFCGIYEYAWEMDDQGDLAMKIRKQFRVLLFDLDYSPEEDDIREVC